MKSFLILLVTLFATQFCKAQPGNSISSGVLKPDRAIKNGYAYQPPKGLLIPPNIKAEILYKKGEVINVKFIPLNKAGNIYHFLFQAPDSASSLIIGIVNADKVDDQNGLTMPKMEVVDNNDGAGFIVDIYDTANREKAHQKLMLAGLLNDPKTRYYLDIKTPGSSIIKLYEDAYKMNSALVEQHGYLDYLMVLYAEKGEALKPKLLAYARRLCNEQQDEQKWLSALNLYEAMDMYDDSKLLDSNILSVFPNGELAKQKYWHDFYKNYNNKGNTENAIMDSMNNYISRFNDSSDNLKDHFYEKILFLFFQKKDWPSFFKYQQLYNRKSLLATTINGFTKELSGKQLSDPASDLKMAKLLSGQLLTYIEDDLETADSTDIVYQRLQGDYYRSSSTYALILFKSGQYDSAFYYQDLLYKKGAWLNAEGIERYAVYAEKAKGINYAKEILEEHLLKGVNSQSMLSRLQTIYKQLNMPEDVFAQLQKKNNDINAKQNNEIIKRKFGTTRATNFELTNIAGQKKSLSSLKNKVVVLDFWATWCGPCIASFPGMQLLVNKYKEDSTVVFLFIDVWERTGTDKVKTAVQKIMVDNNYSFNVLFDTTGNTAASYKVEGIPAKFVIDKHGDIVYMGEISNNISWVIEEVRK